jgi:hypothetical protein
MAISFTCSCGRALSARVEHAGQTGRCPACGATVPIPGPAKVGQPGAIDRGTEIAAEVLPPRRDPAGAEEGADDQAISEKPWDGRGESEELALAPPAYKLFRPAAVVWATFFGNFFGGAVILALNYRRLGNRRAAWVTLLIAGGLLACYVPVLASLPGRFVGATLPVTLAMLLVMSVLATRLQGKLYEDHVRRGGPQASGWAAVGIGLLCWVATAGAIVGIAWAADALLDYSPDLGKRVPFGRDQDVYYRKGVTEAEAWRVGDTLRQAGWFGGPGAATVQVRKDGGRYVVALVVRDGTWNDPASVREVSALGSTIARDAFGGRPVVVEVWAGNSSRPGEQ